jgi:carboxylesterase
MNIFILLLIEISFLVLLITNLINKNFYGICFGIVGALITAVKVFDYFKIKKTNQVFNQFNLIEELGNFSESGLRISSSLQKHKYGVLLLHGFSASTYELRHLIKVLEKEGIPYYLPTLTGFGLEDLHILRALKYSDWLRDVVSAYDILSSKVEEIYIVGHSMGGLLALYLSNRRRVKKVIITAPYLLPKDKHEKFKKLFKYKYLTEAVLSINPVINKFKKKESLLEIYSEKRFAISAFPYNAVIALWQIQEMIDYRALDQVALTIIFGAKDTTVHEEKVVKFLKSKSVSFEKYILKNSRHNILEDIENDVAIKLIIDKIKLN